MTTRRKATQPAQATTPTHASRQPHRTLRSAPQPSLPGAGYAGNQAALRRLSRTTPHLQRKLQVGAINDPLEAEADRVADQIMRMGDPGIVSPDPAQSLHRKCAACEEGDAATLRTSSYGGMQPGEEAPSIVHQALSSPGQPLDSATREFYEPRFGADFSDVRLHSDAVATQSAGAVNAAAYAVGQHVVMGAGAEGRPSRLLAHELAHVVQQGTSGHAAGRQSIRRQGTGATQPQVDPVIEAARAAAFGRVVQAKMKVAGIGPPSPADPAKPGQQLPDTGAYETQQKVRRYASLFFAWENPNMEQIAQILESMVSALSPGAVINRAAAGDSNCGNRAGYVIGHRPPIVLCPAFFTSSPEERIRTMVHESAHRAGIGQPDGEGYCAVFDYSGPCPGDFSSADSWAQFVNAVTDQPPDKPPVVTGRPAAGGGTSPGGAKP